METDSYNAAILALWEESFEDASDVRVPLLYPPMERGALVFIGFNPSFSERGWRHLSKFWPDSGLDPNEFFAWSNRATLDVELAGHLERVAREQYAYFKPGRTLASSLELPWEHLDVFAIREKNQQRAVEQVFSDRAKLLMNPFGDAQFRLFEALLESAKPCAVVIANALASRLYIKQRSPTFDVESGCYFDEIGGGRVLLFFCGMLTGQRALDEFSRDRLFWQLARILGHEWRPTA